MYYSRTFAFVLDAPAYALSLFLARCTLLYVACISYYNDDGS